MSAYAYMYSYAAGMLSAAMPCLTNALFLGDKPLGLEYLDKSGLGNNIPYSDSNCLKLNGVDNYFEVESTADSLYIYIQLYLDEILTTGSNAYLLSNINTNGYAIRITPTGDVFVFAYYTTQALNLTIPSSVTFEKIAIVIEYNTFNVYLDEVLYYTRTSTGIFKTNTTNDYFGRLNLSPTDYGSAKILNISACKVQLTAQELSEFLACDFSNISDKLAYCITTEAGDGTQVHDIKNNVGITVQGTLTSIWSTQDLMHRNINNGFSISGNKVIDIGYAITQETPIDITANLKMQIGVRELDANCILGNYSGFYGIEFGDLSVITTVAFDNNSHRFRIENKEFYIDEVLVSDLSIVLDFETSFNFFVGAINENGTATEISVYDTYTSVDVDSGVIDLSSLQYIELPAQLDDPTLDVDGNTLTNPAIDGHNGCSTLMNFAGLGTTIGKVAYNEVIPELNSIYWRKDYLVDGVKTGETLHMVLSAEQTEKCFNDNVKFYDVEIVTEEDGVTPITEEDGITYIIED